MSLCFCRFASMGRCTLGRPTVLLQYDKAQQTDAVRAAALASPPFSIRDDDISGKTVDKEVTVAVGGRRL